MQFLRYKLLFAAIVAIGISANAQTITSSNPGLFGIDGDVLSGQALNGSFAAASSHDWFLKQGGTGIGIFDTIGTSAAIQQISSGNNYSFTKKMQQERFSTHDGMLFMEATYSRDEIAIGGTRLDKTMFASSAQAGNTSAMNPSNWSGTPAGGSPQDKTDIVDAYVHIRRLSNSNNRLIAYLGASTLGTTGNRYFDFEFYRSKISYDSVNGTFSNSGPASTGGHTAFTFRSDGTINQYGDMTLSISFSSTTVTAVDIYIWTDYNTYISFVPRDFSFTSSSWVGLNQNSGFGYAKIQPKAGNSFNLWGMVNTSATAAPPWGTNSKDLGTNANSYYSSQYATGQFGEAAIDLTSLGIDPLVGVTSNQCAPPYTKVFVKSRASSSFSSALSDFIKPFDFLDVPSTAAAITGPATLTCTQTTGLLEPFLIAANMNYTWSTVNGNLTSRTDSTSASINKAGTYYLSATILGCNVAAVDSIIVGSDTYKPKASAMYTGVLTSDSNSYVTLRGGDTAASKYNTPYGTSQGLLWNWSGPDGFSRAVQNPTTKTEGTYKLVVAEVRNGCMDSVNVTVLKQSLLSADLLNFTGKQHSSSVNLEWTVDNNHLTDYFEIQKSQDGRPFATIDIISAETLPGVQTYMYSYKSGGNQSGLYRIKIVSRNKSLEYSRVLTFSKNELTSAVILGNPVEANLAVSCYTSESRSGEAIIYSAASGSRVSSKKIVFQKGINVINLPMAQSLPKGVYVLELAQEQQKVLIRFIKN